MLGSMIIALTLLRLPAVQSPTIPLREASCLPILINMTLSSHSLLTGHYPVIKQRDGVRYLWNPVSRSLMRDRPEERVRLRCIEFLRHESFISPAHVSTEKGVSARVEHGRTDILCYDKELKPLLLIECKSENVALSLAAAEQSARYNTRIHAPWVMLTNGINDALYHVEGSLEPVPVQKMPYFPTPSHPYTNTRTSYWIDRGFLPDSLPQAQSKSLALHISSLFQNPELSVIRLPVSLPDHSEPWYHYFTLLSHEHFPSIHIAVGFLKISQNHAELLVSGRPGGQTIRIALSKDTLPDQRLRNILFNSDPGFAFNNTLFEYFYPVLFKRTD